VSGTAITCIGCGSSNRAGRKFCAQCGASLAPACPQCGTLNEPGERFCGECGHGLAPDAAPRAGRPEAVREGERKQVTILFADVQGSMTLQEHLDDEDWAGIIDRFFHLLSEGVQRFEGTVDKFTGDGIMALFGAPIAHEDHARRACHAALTLATTVDAYADELRRTRGLEFQVRLGLNSGEVVVGRIGDDLSIEYTALGHTVGLAQRMEALAEPGCVYLSEHTARLVAGHFRLADLGCFDVKGVTGPVQVFRLDGPASGSPSAAPASPRHASALVGRTEELATLEAALAAAEDSRAQVVGIVGEAGVGKSRLCEEFARACAARGLPVRRAAGVSHGRSVPLLPVLQLLRDYFAISDGDPARQAREKIAGRLVLLDPSFAEDLPLLFDFLEVPDSERPAPALAPEARMRRVFEVMRRITQRRSEQETLVLLLEDLHWFDPQSGAFLEQLIPSFPGTRTLVVTNFRPEFVASWMRHSYYRQVPLQPLAGEDVRRLLDALVGSDPSLTPLRDHVVTRTGGNPFFIEEVVRDLAEDGTLAGGPGNYHLTRPFDEVRIPPTVQSVLAARIDRLAPRDKAVLQTAAVVGRTFAEPVLRLIAAGEDLDRALRALCDAELLQEQPPVAVPEYRFWHPLTQEVAYRSLLNDRRMHLHAAVAEALVELGPDRLDEQAALIAAHWEQAGGRLQAARWNHRAGVWASRSNIDEALRRWRAVVDGLEGVEEGAESLELGAHARMRLLQFEARQGIDLEVAEGLYAETRARAEQLGDRSLVAMAVNVSGSVALMHGDVCGARDRYLEASRIWGGAQEPEVHAALCVAPPVALTYVGPLAEGLVWCDRGLVACDGDPEWGLVFIGYSPLGRLLQFRAGILVRMGRPSEAAGDLQRALALSGARRELETLAWSLALVPQLAWLTGQASGMEADPAAAAAEARRLGEDSNNVSSLAVGLEGEAIAHLMAGRSEAAVDVCQRALAETRRRRSGLFAEAELLAQLARARLATGDVGEAAVAAEEAVSLARRRGLRVSECLALLARAQAFRAAGSGTDVSAAHDDIAAGLELVAAMGAGAYEPFLWEERARLNRDPDGLAEAATRFAAVGAAGHARRLGAGLQG